MSEFILGVIARQNDRCEEALEHFGRAEQEKRRRPHAVLRTLHAQVGECLVRLGRAAEAERAFLAEIEVFPASVEGRLGLARLYWTQGRKAQAREALAGLVTAEKQPGASSYWHVVRGLSAFGDREARRPGRGGHRHCSRETRASASRMPAAVRAKGSRPSAGARFRRLALAGSATALACAVAHAGPAGDTRPQANLLLITIDTLRADRLHAYGYASIETPATDRLAREGVLVGGPRRGRSPDRALPRLALHRSPAHRTRRA